MRIASDFKRNPVGKLVATLVGGWLIYELFLKPKKRTLVVEIGEPVFLDPTGEWEDPYAGRG